jgi:hypothetical protein
MDALPQELCDLVMPKTALVPSSWPSRVPASSRATGNGRSGRCVRRDAGRWWSRARLSRNASSEPGGKSRVAKIKGGVAALVVTFSLRDDDIMISTTQTSKQPGAVSSAFLDEYMTIADIADARLLSLTWELGVSSLSQHAGRCLLSAMRSIVLFEWPEEGVNFRMTLREGDVLACSVTQFDRTLPADALEPPRVEHFDAREDAVERLVVLLRAAATHFER